MGWNELLLAYIGPETIIPATSVIAAVFGVLLTFGKWVTRPLVAACQAFGAKKKNPGEPKPE